MTIVEDSIRFDYSSSQTAEHAVWCNHRYKPAYDMHLMQK